MMSFRTVLLVFGLTLVGAFGALAFEGGIIADTTGGVGSTTPVQFIMLGTGVAALVGAGVLYIVSRIRSRKNRRWIDVKSS